MKKDPYFSVVIPAYNVSEFIDYTFKSILAQTYDDYEVIVVNDCSTDNSQEVINTYALQNDKFIKINHSINKGAGAARNSGLKIVRGEYVLFLDSDDRLVDSMVLERIKDSTKDKSPDILYMGYIENDKNYLPDPTDSTMSNEITPAVWSKCWRRKFLEENVFQFDEGIYYEDMSFSLKGSLLAENIEFLLVPTVNHITRKGSIMSQANLKKCSDQYRYMASVMDLYTIVSEEKKHEFLQYILNEHNEIPYRISLLLEAIEKGEGVARDYIIGKEEVTL